MIKRSGIRKAFALEWSAIFSSFLMLTVVALYLFSPTFGSHADTVDVGLSVTPAISVATSDNHLAITAMPETFASGSIMVDVSTNSRYGYTLAIEDTDSDNAMTSETTTDVVDSDYYGSKTSETMPENNWGYSVDNDKYYAVPVYSSPALLGKSDSPTTDGEVSINLYFGAKVGKLLSSGTYSDVVLISAYTNGVDGGPEDEVPEITDPTLEGNSEDDYDDVGLCNTTKDLYDISTMQRITPCIVLNTTTPDKTATAFDWDGSHAGDTSYVPRKVLVDTRDGTRYLVSKLADGNVWMSQNLALDISSVTLTSDTTNLKSKSSWKLSDTSSARQVIQPAARAYYRNGLTASSTPTDSSDEYLWESSGIHYNFYAATAGYGTPSNLPSGNSPDSICPKGWKLAPSNGYSSYDDLARSYYKGVVSRITKPPLNYPMAGYDGGRVGDTASYWSGTGNGNYSSSMANAGVYDSIYDSSWVGSMSNSGRTIVMPMRCIAERKPGIHGVETMQRMTAAVCSATTTPSASATLTDWNGEHNGDTSYVPRTIMTDSRDGKEYIISKLPDGNCWMTQNLAFDLAAGHTLTKADTDLNYKDSWTPVNSTQTTAGTVWAATDDADYDVDHSYHPQESESYYKGGTTKSSSPTGTQKRYFAERAGNYYNWNAATAGSGIKYTTSTSMNDSICPKGWRLPLGSGSTESKGFPLLTNNVAANSLVSAPYNFTLAGRYDRTTGNMTAQETNGYYWTVYNYGGAVTAFTLDLSTKGLAGSDRGQGYSVRCVVR